MTLSPSRSPKQTSSKQTSATLLTAEENLKWHDLRALFLQSLGWESPPDTIVGQICSHDLQQQCVPIAYKQGTVVWQVQLSKADTFSSDIRQRICSKLSNQHCEVGGKSDSPLIVFVSADNTRSLWCQNTPKNRYESALYISGQPISLWRFRLARLAKSNRGVFRSHDSSAYEAFKPLLNDLCQGITGISNVTDRQNYAMLTLQRLVLLQAIQQKRWLNNDIWYLQTRFQMALQENRSFFKDCLQPLYQSLALPKIERPITLNETIGKVPFLGYLFHIHRLEQIYTNVAIDNRPFEQILGWLSEQTSTDGLNPWMSGNLGYCLEKQLANQRRGKEPSSDRSLSSPGSTGIVCETPLEWSCQRIIKQLLINRLPSAICEEEFADLNDLLFNANAKTCRYFIQEVLPNLRILDPACDSGNLLVAIYQQLTEIFSVLIGHGRQTQDRQLSIWQAGLTEEVEATNHVQVNVVQAVQQRILKNNIYGVDISIPAIESTVFHLLLHTISTAQSTQDIEPLVDLSFNLLAGNSLIGLISVDEERFEKTNKTGDRDILQGNLLQPLVADSYQTILAEKNLAVEHYKYRNQMLADAKNVPDYARAALLKEDILRLDIKAQDKLDRLLLHQMSQQLGIQYKAAQLAEKPQRRPLTLEDIDILQPFHWGYHFNQVMAKGGFDIVVCVPPQGAFKPTVAEFLQKFRDLAEVKGVSVRSLKTSKQALAKGDPEIAQAWLFYQDQYAYVADYFYRSEQYRHQNPTVEGKTVRNQLARERLFLERCTHLLAPKGIGVAIVEETLLKQPKAKILCEFMKGTGQIEVLDGEGDRIIER